MMAFGSEVRRTERVMAAKSAMSTCSSVTLPQAGEQRFVERAHLHVHARFRVRRAKVLHDVVAQGSGGAGNEDSL